MYQKKAEHRCIAKLCLRKEKLGFILRQIRDTHIASLQNAYHEKFGQGRSFSPISSMPGDSILHPSRLFACFCLEMPDVLAAFGSGALRSQQLLERVLTNLVGGFSGKKIVLWFASCMDVQDPGDCAV